jgi:hypothetical protein
VTYARKIFGEDKVKGVLKRLDQLTQDEVRAAVAQTLNVVHNLEEGMQSLVELSLTFCQACLLLDGKVSTRNIRQDLGMCLGPEMTSISAAHLRWQLPFIRKYI